MEASTLVEGGCDNCPSLYSLRKTGQLWETCEFAADYREYVRNHDGWHGDRARPAQGGRRHRQVRAALSGWATKPKTLVFAFRLGH
jgi:hypothetical protein